MDTFYSSIGNEARAKGYRSVSAYMRAQKRSKALREVWNEYGKPLAIAAVILPFLYIGMVVAIIVLQSITGEYSALNY